MIDFLGPDIITSIIYVCINIYFFIIINVVVIVTAAVVQTYSQLGTMMDIKTKMAQMGKKELRWWVMMAYKMNRCETTKFVKLVFTKRLKLGKKIE